MMVKSSILFASEYSQEDRKNDHKPQAITLGKFLMLVRPVVLFYRNK